LSASAIGVAGAGAQTRRAATRQPNFVIFLADDLGCHDVGACGATDLKTGACGATDLKTPNIDVLAGSGVRFTNWYAAAPVCAPRERRS
jgi:arylsulfatase A-like enzyme